MSLSDGGVVVVAFKLDQPYHVQRMLPCFKWLSYDTLIHCEFIIQTRCKSNGCNLCQLSCDPHHKHRNPNYHYLTFSVTQTHPWHMLIDAIKYYDSDKWFYLQLPTSIQSEDVVKFMMQHLDSQWNASGALCVPFYRICSCCICNHKYSSLPQEQEQQQQQQQNFFCSELITIAIQTQNEQMLPGLLPKASSPILLYEQLKQTPGVVDLKQQHPSSSSSRT